ncbi:MAG: hypothetical protein ACOC0J_03160, partial [Myxococcota bacterium]
DATCSVDSDDEVALCPEEGDLCCDATCHPPSSLQHCGRCGNRCESPDSECLRAACSSGACRAEPVSDGTACSQDGGVVCSSGSCIFRCQIGGVFYDDGVTSPGNDCLVCRPDVDPYQWTTRTDGSGCGGGTCWEGSCMGSCTTPWGATLIHDQSVIAYQSESVGCYETCTSQSRKCVDGTLLGSYQNRTCSPFCLGCESSTQTWGNHDCQASLASGPHHVERARDNVATGRSGSATYRCENGTWSLQQGTCEPDPCNLPWGGQLAHGQSVTAYESSSAACGAECTAETRSCSYGVLSGSYDHETCSASCAPCSTELLSWGEHGCQASFEAAGHGTMRSLDNEAEGRTGSAAATCNDGTWVLDTQSSCAPDPCPLPWDSTLSISHGEQVIAYEAESVPCGSTCNDENRLCGYGQLSGSYQYESCFEQGCLDCATETVSWGTDPVCSDEIAAGVHDETRLATANGNPQGSASFTCSNGNWVLESGDCSVPNG